MHRTNLSFPPAPNLTTKVTHSASAVSVILELPMSKQRCNNSTKKTNSTLHPICTLHVTRDTMAESQRKGKAKKFSLEWILKYGLEVATRNPPTSEVTSVLCLFCRSFGREDEDVERKRKRTTNLKYFSYPWRADNFSSHLKLQHPVKWNEYTSLSVEDKKNSLGRMNLPKLSTCDLCSAGREYEGSHHCKAKIQVHN